MRPRFRPASEQRETAGWVLFASAALMAAALVAEVLLVAGCNVEEPQEEVVQADAGAPPKADDPVPDEGTPITSNDSGGVTAPAPPPARAVAVSAGINRNIVAGYGGDTCGSVATLLVIEAAGPTGSLGRQELDCLRGGYNGWTWYDQKAGTYTATVQLFDVDDAGNRTAATPPRQVRGELGAGTGLALWADFTYRDFDKDFNGNLKWQIGWVSAAQPDLEFGCTGATPSVAQQRITVRDDVGALVDSWARGPDGFVVTDGSAAGPCSSFGASEAQVVTGLPWGVYDVTIEGLDASGQVAYCTRRPLFAANGEGVIFHLTATTGVCPAR